MAAEQENEVAAGCPFFNFLWFSPFLILGEVDGLDMMNQNELDAEMDMAMNAGGYS